LGIIKSKTQFGEHVFFECSCGSHLIRLYKDDNENKEQRRHSLQLFEFRGDTGSRTFLDRIKLGLSIIFGLQAKHCTYDVLVTHSELTELANALLDLKDDTVYTKGLNTFFKEPNIIPPRRWTGLI
jgi:hypothetical protein